MRVVPPAYKSLSYELIDAYRDLIGYRYSGEYLDEHLHLLRLDGQYKEPFTPEFIEKFRHYFLTYVFPPSKDRARLENAFEKLNSYITSPSKMWYLMGNITGAVFKFGRLFPRALKAGFVSMRLFERAMQFENQILQAAIDNNFTQQIDRAKILKCLKSIPHEDTNKFIADINSFLKSMTHSELLSKTIEILNNVVETMKKYPQTYGADEVEGVVSGILIIEKGYELFNNLNEEQRLLALDTIIKIEFDFLNHIYD